MKHAKDDARDQNHIRVDMGEDGLFVIITIHVGNKDLAWIEYDKDQLDGLIELLQKFRRKIDA